MITIMDIRCHVSSESNFVHHEYLHPNLCRQCLLKVGIIVDESTMSEGLTKYDLWFQLAFQSWEVWELQDRILSMWERKEVKGQRLKKAKLDPQVNMK